MTVKLHDKLKCDDEVFCVLPFLHGYVHSAEEPKVCCTFERYDSNRIPNKQRDLKEEWESDYFKDIRRDILDGKKVKGCRRCYIAEQVGSISDRVLYNERWNNKVKYDDTLPEITLNIETGNNFGTPLDLDLRPGNLCNLACRMCGPTSSSQFNKEMKKLPERWGMFIFNEEWQTQWLSDSNLSFLLENIEVGQRIKFLGGEPTIMPEVLSIMDNLIDSGKCTNVEIALTTNLTNVNENFLEKLNKFKRLDIQISMDGVGKTLEYIRYPIKWSQMQKNIQAYADLGETVSRILQFTIQAYNITNILDTLLWMEEFDNNYIDFVDINNNSVINFSPEILYFPEYFSYRVLPKKFRDKYIKEILSHPVIDRKFADPFQRTKSKLKQMLSDNFVDDPSDFLRHTAIYDLSRKQHLKDYIPELYEIFKDEYDKQREALTKE